MPLTETTTIPLSRMDVGQCAAGHASYFELGFFMLLFLRLVLG